MKYLVPISLTLFSLFVLIASPLIVKHAKAFAKDVVLSFSEKLVAVSGRYRTQGGYVTLLRNYAGYAAGTVVELPASLEATLIAANQATTSAGPPTAGPVTTTATSGACAIATGQSSITITNSLCTVQSIVFAVVAQAAADTTLLRVERVVAAAGSFTIYGTAAATANTTIDWVLILPNGAFSNPQ